MKAYIPTLLALGLCLAAQPAQAQKPQTIEISGRATGPTFDGIGIVNGGGATSVLLKDYPEQQRSEILDMVYRPKWGASVSALLVEIPGDGNSTQGSMPSHSHYRGDYNYRRGYTWWVLTEAKKRNPKITLDGTAWSAPGWLGGGKFWTQDVVDYYVSWLQGLRTVYGLELDAIGCRNEKGENYPFAIALKKGLRDNGFENVKLHAFDNWPKRKLDFLEYMKTDSALQDAVDVVSAHTFSSIPVTPEQWEIVKQMNKPIWNTEDHIYKKGFECLIGVVETFNRNYIESHATKIVNWYDIAGVYPMEPYSNDPPMILAREPWSGYYKVRQNTWGYAHYGQFTEAGWTYVDPACKNLDGGGTVVTMRSPEGDYSVIIETKDAKEPQTVTFKLTNGTPKTKLCLWRSTEKEQFERLDDITPKGGKFTLTLEPYAVYSLSTTTGQQKGTFNDIPTEQAFPLPYADDFDQYDKPEEWGYLPRYTADIIGVYELTERPDHRGQCIRQVVGEPAQSWGPAYHYYTILGDSAWTDYEVSADMWLNPGDEAGVMGHVCDVGSGWGCVAKGYYLKLSANGQCTLMITRGKRDKKALVGDAEQQAAILASTDKEVGGEYVLDSVALPSIRPNEWHKIALRFEGDEVVGLVDGNAVVKASCKHYPTGMAGLIAIKGEKNVATPYFDNLSVKPVGRSSATTARATGASKKLYKVL